MSDLSSSTILCRSVEEGHPTWSSVPLDAKLLKWFPDFLQSCKGRKIEDSEALSFSDVGGIAGLSDASLSEMANAHFAGAGRIKSKTASE